MASSSFLRSLSLVADAKLHPSLLALVSAVEFAIQSMIPVAAAGDPMEVETVAGVPISDPGSPAAIRPCYCQMEWGAKAHECSVAC